MTLRQRWIELAFVGGAAVVPGTLVLLAVLSWGVRGTRMLPVLQPLLVLIAAATVFFAVLLHRERSVPFFSLGGFAGAVVLLYCLYPLGLFILFEGVYVPGSDLRFYLWPPAPEEIALFGWWYVLFFAAFACAYLLAGPSAKRRAPLSVAPLPPGMLTVILTTVIGVQAFLTGMGWLFGLGSAGYFDAYLEVQRLPLLIRQLYVHSAQMHVTLLIVLLVVLFSDYRRYRRWIVLVALVQIGSAAQGLGSRAELFMFLVAMVVLYHNLVRRIPLWLAAAGGVALVAAFVLLGSVRAGGGRGVIDVLRGDSEFETILANAYDLRSIKHASGALIDQPAVYFADVLNVVPQQLLPFPKRDKAEWLLTTYYPNFLAAGRGLAFGLLAEAVTGFGWIELLVRGAIVGLAFGLLQRRLAGTVSVWRMAFYVWVLVFAYQILRNTTFSYLVLAEYGFVAPMLAIRGGYAVLARGARRIEAPPRTA